MRLPLPEALKKRLRATPQWLAISALPSELSVDVSLVTPDGEHDISGNHAVAALRPLTVRIGLDSGFRIAPGQEVSLRFFDRLLARPVGLLRLRYLGDWDGMDARMGLFEVTGGTHFCAPWPRRVWDTFMYERAVRKVKRETLLMPPVAVEQLMVYNLLPRPVFFVGVDDGRHSNLFPMDLMGPQLPNRFTLALRNTSASVETMKASRRIVLGDIPGSACQIAYALGAHHKQPNIDAGGMPFKLLRSRLFGLPVPEIALRVREIEILEFQTIGSHTLFFSRICSEERLAEGPGLFHTSVIYQRLRAAHGHAFHEAYVPSAK